jgi:L-threonylcarbamoyladenylate synthase
MKIIKESDHNSIDLACEFLNQGKIISFATDTVYGVGVDASNPKAVEGLFKLKNRDPKKPIALFLKNLAMARNIFNFDRVSEEFAKKFESESLTLVLEKKASSSQILANNLNLENDQFLGFRIIKKPFVTNLFNKFDGNLAVTSANPSNQKSANSASEVENYFINSGADLLLIDGGNSDSGIASAVIKIHNEKVQIIRPNSTFF